jgi:hypothetical protein
MVDPIVIEVTQFGSAISLAQVRRIRVGGRPLSCGWIGSPSPFSFSINSSSRYYGLLVSGCDATVEAFRIRLEDDEAPRIVNRDAKAAEQTAAEVPCQAARSE